jgi:hypothetical protein
MEPAVRKFFLVVFASILSGCLAHAQDALPRPTTRVLLTVTGKIDRTNSPQGAEFDRPMLEALGMVKLLTSTNFTDGRKEFDGIPLAALLARVGANGASLRATALNNYATTFPLTDLAYEPILAMRMDGVVLTPRDKGPLWIVFPKDRFSTVLTGPYWDQKWVWQLDRLSVE